MAGVPSLLWAQQAPFELKGKVGNVNAPVKIYLAKEMNPQSIIDSSDVKDGRFALKGMLPAPMPVIVIFANDTMALVRKRGVPPQLPRPDIKGFYLNVGVTEINGPSLAGATITGASEKLKQDDMEFNEALQSSRSENSAIGQLSIHTPPEVQKTEAFQKMYNAKVDSADAHTYKIVATFVKTHPNSIVSLYAMASYMRNDPSVSELKETFNLLSADVRNTPQGKAYAQGLMNQEKTMIGNPAPDFEQKAPDGKLVKLSSFKGKYVFLDFWASWCVPCRAENPNVVKAYQKYKDANFVIVSVSLDESKDAWTQAIAKDGMPWIHTSDLKAFKNEAAVKYDIHSIPSNFLIDPNGKIIAKGLRGAKLEEKLAEVL
jgi:thiol-disulfide isomerase/thioredoxin